MEGKKKHVEDFLKKYEEVQDAYHTTQNKLITAYAKARENKLQVLDKEGNSTGQISQSKMEDVAIREAVAKETEDILYKSIEDFRQKAYGVEPRELKSGDRDREMILQEYAGITGQQLRELIRNSGDEYTAQVHGQVSENVARSMRDRLRGAAASTVDESHIEDIVNELGLKEGEGLRKDYPLQREDLQTLAGIHFDNGRRPLNYKDVEKYFKQNQQKTPVYVQPDSKAA